MLSEHTVRLVFFLGTLLIIAVWEVFAPRRPLNDHKARRWFTNISFVMLNTLAVRILLPVMPAGLALTVQERGWGVMNVFTMPYWLKLVLALLVLDLVIYLQHVLFHFTPLLWRIHRMHHTDLDIDVTTGNRFHPIEIVISMLVKLAVVFLIGPPAVAVVVFEVVLNASAQFNHGNILIAGIADKWLRLAIVTPDMHRVHHSVIPRETNCNFGFNVPWWDRLFGTYRPEPVQGHLGMSIGLKEYRVPEQLTFAKLLLLPFSRG